MEFYGALLGDGWLSALKYNYGNLWWIGISGHSKLDREYLNFIKDIVKKLFNRKITTKYKKNQNGMEILFSHKQLIFFMNKKLGFPIGKKMNLRINNNFIKDWNKIKYIIRGIFDTDGSFYLDKTPSGNPYPIISIHMKAPILLKQINKQLLSRGFKTRFRRNEIILKGRKQLDKWMGQIGSSNQKHLNKINALVAQ